MEIKYFIKLVLCFQCLTMILCVAQDFDFFYFVQQWPGSYCDTKKSCCYPKTGKPPTDFGIHGLWPNRNDGSYPSNCDPSNFFDQSKRSLVDKKQEFQEYREQAQDFVCKILLPNSPYSSTKYTPGGLMFKLTASNLQYVTSITFLLTTSKSTFHCGNLLVTPKTLRTLAKRQVDYILGENPMKMSYNMVGYGKDYPGKVHHRGSSMPSTAKSFGCKGGFEPFYYTSKPNPNILTGAIVGGPNQNDFFSDVRTDYSQSEPATYINAAIVGPLAYFAGRD